MKTGDLVKMKLGYSAPGVVVSFRTVLAAQDHRPEYRRVRVLWSDAGMGSELEKDLEVISPSSKAKR